MKGVLIIIRGIAVSVLPRIIVCDKTKTEVDDWPKDNEPYLVLITILVVPLSNCAPPTHCIVILLISAIPPISTIVISFPPKSITGSCTIIGETNCSVFTETIEVVPSMTMGGAMSILNPNDYNR